MKRFVQGGVRVAEFHLVDDVVELVWLVPGLERWIGLDSILDEHGRELTRADGRAFFDRLERAYPGSIELA